MTFEAEYLAVMAVIVVHATLYFLVLRKRAHFAQERAIFLYHVVAAALTAVALVGSALISEQPVSPDNTVGPLLLLGIYSLSFLELWALADDSYSLAILNRFHDLGGEVHDLRVLGDLRDIGERKQRGRLHTLVRLHLVRVEGQLAALTGIGRAVAVICRIGLGLLNIRRQG